MATALLMNETPAALANGGFRSVRSTIPAEGFVRGDVANGAYDVIAPDENGNGWIAECYPAPNPPGAFEDDGGVRIGTFDSVEKALAALAVR